MMLQSSSLEGFLGVVLGKENGLRGEKYKAHYCLNLPIMSSKDFYKGEFMSVACK